MQKPPRRNELRERYHAAKDSMRKGDKPPRDSVSDLLCVAIDYIEELEGGSANKKQKVTEPEGPLSELAFFESILKGLVGVHQMFIAKFPRQHNPADILDDAKITVISRLEKLEATTNHIEDIKESQLEAATKITNKLRSLQGTLAYHQTDIGPAIRAIADVASQRLNALQNHEQFPHF